jgi:hypothetical protein
MKVCFAPTLPLWLLKIPLRVMQASFMSTTSMYSGAQIGVDKGNSWGPAPAPSTDGMDGAAAHIQHSTQEDPHQMCGCLWRDCSLNTAKHSHQIMAYELTVLALCWACSLQMNWFPIGHSRYMQMYDNLDTHCSENTCDKKSASLPLKYTALYAK